MKKIILKAVVTTAVAGSMLVACNGNTKQAESNTETETTK